MTTSHPRILAVHEDTNANAAVLEGTRIIAAVAEERLTRTKFQAGFPEHAVAEVLAIAGLRLSDIDAVVAGNRFHFLPRLTGGRSLMEGEHDLFGLPHKAWLSLQARFASEGPLARAAESFSRWALGRRFGRPVELHDHHTAHAYSAWLTSDFPEATAVSVDNMGDGFASRVFRCGGGRCEPLWGSDAIASPGQFYGEISQFLGFHVLMAGKVTGLAAQGDPAKAYSIMERLFSLDRDGTGFRLEPLWRKHRKRGLFRELARFDARDVAAAAQRRLEDVLVAYVRRAVRETGLGNVVLAGGVFGNVLLNQRIWELPEVTGVFVHPAMSDQGIAVGAALAALARLAAVEPRRLTDVFLGPEYSEEEIGLALDQSRLAYRRPGDLESEVADRIVRGEVVARYTGRLEYGPRALGHRSILCATTDPTVNDWLNARLERSEFMPFAPATLAEYATRCYEGYGPGIEHTARFMTVTFPCTEAMKRQSPAVVHIDGTARPQVVHEETDPGYYRILRLVLERSGIPSIINTSFNQHGEPIVCTPDDAIRSFRQGRLDAMAIGPFLVEGSLEQR
jgi:carbamoyltransferase